MVKQCVTLILKCRIPISVLLVLLVGLSAYQTLHKLRVDNSLGIWFLEDNPNYRAYINYQEQFGSDEIFVGMLPLDNALEHAHIKRLEQLHTALDTLGYVKTSYSLAKAQYPIYTNGKVLLRPLYNEKRSIKGLKSILSKMPNIKSRLVSEDLNHLFFYIQLNPTHTIEAERHLIAGKLRTLIEQHFTNYHLTGAPVLNEAYSLGIYKESSIFGILTIVVISIMLLFLLPNKRYLPVALLCVAVPTALLFGFITSFGFALNMISMLIPTILMVYSVSDAVHVINIYHNEGVNNPNFSKITVLTSAITKSLKPCFYTTLTTFIGYFALYLSPLPAFKNMGVFTCLGLLLSFVLVYIICVISFSFMGANFAAARPLLVLKSLNTAKVIAWVNHSTTTRKNTIVTLFTLVLIAGVYAVFKVPIDTNSLDLLAEGKAKSDLQYVESQLGSSSRLQLNITAKEGDMLSAEALNLLANFQKTIDQYTLTTAPISVVNVKLFLEQQNPLAFQNTISKAKLAATVSEINTQSHTFYKLFSQDYKTAGIVLGVKEIKTSDLKTVLNAIKNDFQATFNTEKFELTINGFSVVFSQLNGFILETQFKSFFAAFFIAFLCLWWLIKSMRTTWLILLPNLLPLAVLAIVMSVLNIPLDVSTAMITPIMLGIVMDDTIHLMHKYQQERANGLNAEQAINSAMRYTGGALCATTIALVSGFLIISSSAVPSVSDFGILCAVTVAIALLTDIFYLPALLKRLDG